MRYSRCLLIVVLLASTAVAGDEKLDCTNDPLAAVLDKIGLNRSTFTFDYSDMSNFGGDRFVLPLFHALHKDFFKIEPYARVFANSVEHNSSRLQSLVSFASSRLDEGVRRGLIGDPLDSVYPLINAPDPLYNAIARLHKWQGAELSRLASKSLADKVTIVPPAIQKYASMLIYASIDTIGYHRMAFEKTAARHDIDAMYAKSQKALASADDIVDFELEDFASQVDFKYLYTHAEDIARAVDMASDSLIANTKEGEFEFDWDSPLGRISLRGTGNDSYGDGEYFITIDAGGDDRYEAGAANRSVGNWVSILIDLGGNDRYESKRKDVPAFGAAVMGYAFLVDISGNDIYKGHNITGGAAIFGVGALLDKSGADSYDGYICAQGAGQFGIGILSDLGGDDKFHAYLLGQGFGFTKGMGILVDMNGNDDYYADTLDIAFPASQTKEHNSNLCQGVGFGKRGDYTDGHSWAGGIGMLVDAVGNDTYSAGVFAQGCAYWYSIGILADDHGDDVYNGVWYVQGSGAHFGVAMLIDSSGNDHYTATMNMAQGAGHDFTLGTLIDCGGDDTYDAPNLSLGGGNDNGFGVFWDKSGNDTYRVSAATTLGRANITTRGSLRDFMECIGIFLDTGGDDTYPADPKYDFARNNTIWQQHGANIQLPLPTERGAGIDCEGLSGK